MKIPDLWTRIQAAGQRPFMVRPSGEVRYDELRALIAKAYTRMKDLQINSGKRIGVLLADEAKASAVFVASLLSGAVPVMLPSDIGAPRLAAIRRTIEPDLIASDDSIFSADAPTPIQINDHPSEELAYLLFTSGTTAAPSGVEITRTNLCSHLETLTRLFNFSPDSRIFNPTPLSHTDGLIFGAILPIATGGSVIRPGPMRLSAFEEWIGLARRHAATHMMTNPTVLSLIERTAERDDYFAYPGFKGILSGGSQLRRELWLHFEERFRTEIWNLYGLSETVTTALYSGRHPDMGDVGTLGKAIDCEARIAPPANLTLPGADDAIGELQLRGANIFRGYWRNPERTTSTFAAGGWMRTGDLVRRNDDGSYEFLGRIKAAINSGGTLVRGEEIDECLLRHPAVAEAVTVGLPDNDFEEIAVSAVVLKREVDEAQLSQHCRNELEVLKVPKRIITLPSIPRGDAGKPSLNSVRDILQGLLQAPAKPKALGIDAIDQTLIELAALVFGLEPQALTLNSSPEDVEGWDSFRHVNLVLQAEDLFSVRIPGTSLSSIKTLGDLSALVRQIKGSA